MHPTCICEAVRHGFQKQNAHDRMYGTHGRVL